MTAQDAAPGFRSVGQAAVGAAARRAFNRGRGRRTLLVHGPGGAGKGAFVDDLLAMLFCTAADREARPCNACRGCRDARARVHPDLLTGSPESWREARSTGESIVAVARRWLLEAAGAPVLGEQRLVLVEGADRANEQAQNALLKALEEPSARQMFILVADEPNRLLPTIRSRCQPLRVGPVPHRELAAWLADRERLPADQADALARISGGLAGRAIELARNAPLVEWRRQTQQELLELVARGPADRLGSVRDLIDAAVRLGAAAPDEVEEALDGEGLRTTGAAQRAGALLVVDAWLGLARDLVVAAAGRADLAPSAQLLPDLAATARGIGIAPLLAFVPLLERVRDGLRQNAAPRLAMEVAVLAWPGTSAAAVAGGR